MHVPLATTKSWNRTDKRGTFYVGPEADADEHRFRETWPADANVSPIGRSAFAELRPVVASLSTQTELAACRVRLWLLDRTV